MALLLLTCLLQIYDYDLNRGKLKNHDYCVKTLIGEKIITGEHHAKERAIQSLHTPFRKRKALLLSTRATKIHFRLLFSACVETSLG